MTSDISTKHNANTSSVRHQQFCHACLIVQTLVIPQSITYQWAHGLTSSFSPVRLLPMSLRQVLRRLLTATSVVPSVQELVSQAKPDSGGVMSILQSRFLIELVTNEDLYDLTETDKKFKLYCGADPSAPSLHLGNLLPLMVLLNFAIRGHSVVGLVGGATGAVGDPSGRTSERQEMEAGTRISNVGHIEKQMATFFSRGIEYAKLRNFPVQPASNEVLNNFTWWKDIGMLEFLAKYGRHIRVSQMLARDSISSRLNSAEGLGFNEFTYQILQAYDFYHMFKTDGVNIQVGGNDQWGNITAGVDLILRLKPKDDNDAYGITVPLLTTPLGEKFGKSAGNAVFIDSEMTTPYQLYQFFINVPDEMVQRLLRSFTLLPIDVIDKVVESSEQDPTVRKAQRVLAREVVDLLHGPGTGDEMAYISSFLFTTPDMPFEDEVSADKLIKAFEKLGILHYRYFLDYPNINDLKLSTLLADITGKSKREVKNLLAQGAVYMGTDRHQVQDPEDIILFDKERLIDGKLLLVRLGKNNYYVVEWK